MAWKWKLTGVDYLYPSVDDAGNPTTVDLSKVGRFNATYDVLDDANAVVDTRTRAFAYGTTNQQAIDEINKDVATVRDARARVTGLKTSVGQTFIVP